MEADARAQMGDVPKLAASLRKVLAGDEPKVRPGLQCDDPYHCPFMEHCEPAEYPVRIFPRATALVERLRAARHVDLRDVPESLLTTEKVKRVWAVTRAGREFLDPALPETLQKIAYPRHYLDFETIGFVVPIWKGTRPYRQLPFQWSLHSEDRKGRLSHREFLDTSCSPPMGAAATALLNAIGPEGPILAYGAFEKTMLRALAKRYPSMARQLEALARRIVNLLPLFSRHYYHPAMQGSWSLKNLLPAVAPELGYEGLGEVTDGAAAQQAYVEIIDPATNATRKAKREADLRAYCARDTLGLRTVVERLSR